MPMRYYETPTGKTIYINDDDFQVLSAVMLADAAKKHAMDELRKRGMFDAVASIKTFNASLVELYTITKPDDAKLARFCYDEMLRILPESKEL